MKKWIRPVSIGLILAGFFFMLGFFNKYHLPQIETWLLLEIEKFSRERLPIGVLADELHVTYFPPGIELKNVRLKPKGELSRSLAPTMIREVDARISLIGLLKGQVRVSTLSLRKADLRFLLKERAGKSEKIDLDLSVIEDIPIDELRLEEINVLARMDAAQLALRMERFGLVVENRFDSILTHVKAPVLEIKQAGESHRLPLDLEFKALADINEIQVSALKLKSGTSFIVGSGRIVGDWLMGKMKSYQVISRSHVDLRNTQSWLKVVKPTFNLPEMSGTVKLETHLESKDGRIPTGSVSLNTEDVVIDGRILGHVTGQGNWTETSLSFPSLSVHNSSGRVDLHKVHIGSKPPYIMSGRVDIQSLEVGQLLRNLKIKAPIRIQTRGLLPCEGKIQDFEMTCKGSVEVAELFVHGPEPKRKAIVKVRNAKADGSVRITKQEVTYDAKLSVGQKGEGQSSGKINYKDGFDISFSGGADFADVDHLAGLKFEGSAEVKGSTVGTSRWARVNIDIDGKDLWLDDYEIGQSQAKLSYRSGVLSIRKIVGQLGTSRYQGHLSIHIPNEHIQVSMRSPYLDLADVRQAFRRKYLLPIEISGSGSAEVKGDGPLKFNQLSYQVRSSFFRGTAAGENFDQFYFNVDAVKGTVVAKRIQWLKQQSAIDFVGQVTPQGQIDSVIRGRAVRLEESEAINRAGLDVTGQLDFTMSMRGQLPQPVLDIHGRLSKMVLGDRGTADSSFRMQVAKEKVSGAANLIGDVVQTEFVIPIDEKVPFRLFVKSNEWDFTHLFSLVSSSARQKNFQTSLTGLIDLKSEKGWYGLNGDAEINDLKVKRGSVALNSKQTIFIRIRDGIVNSRNFQLEGTGGNLRVLVQNATKDAVNTSVNGKVDLSLASLLTPFLTELQGQLALSLNITGNYQSPLTTGSAFIEEGLVRFRDFPHPFESLQADLLFSNQDLVVNTLKAQMGGGTLTGDGKIKILGRNNIPVNVRGRFADVKLDFPEGVRTRGSGEWFMQGQYFPYTLGIQYGVEGGEVVTEFGNGGLGGTRGKVAPSSLLPKFLVQSAEQPIVIDLSVNLLSPLPVRNSVIEAPLRGKLHITGPPNSLRFNGTLTPAPGGKVFFRDVPFEIQNAFVEYRGDPPENPKIYVSAQTEVDEIVQDEAKREIENTYEINLLVQGRAQQPKITVSSLPALTDREIISLLALGMTTGTLEGRTANQLAAENSIQMGASILQKPISKETRDRLGFDVQITQTNSTTDQASYPKFTITKQINPKLGVSASRTIEKLPESAVKMEYKFNKNFSVIGSWEGRDQGASQFEKSEGETSQSILGLDLEYKVNFK